MTDTAHRMRKGYTIGACEMGYFGKFGKSKGIPFMDNAEKGNIRDHLGKQLTLRDYGFINGDNGVYACVCFEELPGRFYFMNAIFTEALQEIERDGKIDDLKRCALVFELATSKTGREYIAFEIIEDEA
jgi:hypothetical protein